MTTLVCIHAPGTCSREPSTVATFELDAWYRDRRGVRWRVIKINGPRIAPITALREGDTYARTFQRDGRYWPDRDDCWDLIAPASFKCPLCGQVITDGKPCGCGARTGG